MLSINLLKLLCLSRRLIAILDTGLETGAIGQTKIPNLFELIELIEHFEHFEHPKPHKPLKLQKPLIPAPLSYPHSIAQLTDLQNRI